ncbi:MAG: iron complex transport system substrate-binding protein [Candidatus Poriferisodalaceae bacterium]|jgi:iron complex transport system substrate-binding protein
MVTSSAPSGSPLTVASLIPSGTDLVAALGLSDSLVGVSHECDHEIAAGLPVLTASNIPAAGTSDGADPGAVDAAVSSTIAAGDSVYLTDRAELMRLQPDVVLTQDICDVCAVNATQAAADVPDGTLLLNLQATSIDGLYDDLRRVGEALGVSARALAIINSINSRLTALQASRPTAPPRVLTLEWGLPPFLGGHWVPELVECAGGSNVLSEAGAPSRRTTWDEILAADPDVVVHLPCGYDLETAWAEANGLLAGPFGQLRAVREGRAWAVNATSHFSRCTPVVAQAAELLASVFAHSNGLGPAPAAHLARRIGTT